jgi:hypothetical protein
MGIQSSVAGAGSAGIVTILNGHAAVIRALSTFDATQGTRLLANDIIKTDGDGLLRVEYPDHTWIDIGPDTQLQLSHPAEKRAKRPALYVLRGWVKMGCTADCPGRRSLETASLDVLESSGVVVLRIGPASTALFVEQGTALWIDRSGGRGSSPATLTQGSFLEINGDAQPKLQPRPSANFLTDMPRVYRDTLPLGYPRFVGSAPAAANLRVFSYADVEPWLDAEPAIRKQFVTVWHAKIRDPAFRASLDHDLHLHPEWDRTLHPEKYEPKEPPPAHPTVDGASAAPPAVDAAAAAPTAVPVPQDH